MLLGNPTHFSGEEVSAASIYMAIKLIEKKNSFSKLINRETFNVLLQESGNVKEQQVIYCARLIFDIIQSAAYTFSGQLTLL
jgi:hypothetical protein